MGVDRMIVAPSPCVGCFRVKECEDRDANDTCRAFRRYQSVSHDAIPWVPADRGVFDRYSEFYQANLVVPKLMCRGTVK